MHPAATAHYRPTPNIAGTAPTTRNAWLVIWLSAAGLLVGAVVLVLIGVFASDDLEQALADPTTGGAPVRVDYDAPGQVAAQAVGSCQLTADASDRCSYRLTVSSPAATAMTLNHDQVYLEVEEGFYPADVQPANSCTPAPEATCLLDVSFSREAGDRAPVKALWIADLTGQTPRQYD